MVLGFRIYTFMHVLFSFSLLYSFNARFYMFISSVEASGFGVIFLGGGSERLALRGMNLRRRCGE